MQKICMYCFSKAIQQRLHNNGESDNGFATHRLPNITWINNVVVYHITLWVDETALPKFGFQGIKMHNDTKVSQITGNLALLFRLLSNKTFKISIIGSLGGNDWWILLQGVSSVGSLSMSYCHQGAVSIRKTVLPGMAIPMLKIRRPNCRLIFNMEIAIRR